MKLSVIIPVFNEENTVAETAEKLDNFLSRNFSGYEIVFCNDGSVDATQKIISDLASSNPNIKAVGYETNRGKGCAVRTAVESCTGDYLLYTDCDLAYGLDIIKTAFDAIIEKKCNILIGSRNLDKESYIGYTFIRKLTSKIYFGVIKLMSGFSHSDSQCGFKVFETAVAKDIFPGCTVDRFAFDLEVLLKAEKKGYSIEEIPVKIIENGNKNSKVNIVKDSIRMLKDIRKIKKGL